MTLTKLQPILDIQRSKLCPKPTFREPEASQKPQHLQSQPGSQRGESSTFPLTTAIPTCISSLQSLSVKLIDSYP